MQNDANLNLYIFGLISPHIHELRSRKNGSLSSILLHKSGGAILRLKLLRNVLSFGKDFRTQILAQNLSLNKKNSLDVVNKIIIMQKKLPINI